MEQAITWVVTGLIVGWLVRTAMKSQRDFGLIGDLVTGSLGAVVGGWLVRQLDIVTPNNLTGHIVVIDFWRGCCWRSAESPDMRLAPDYRAPHRPPRSSESSKSKSCG
jgi:uncharacterized membrane protein YeaQ/YmgE (transglycosylase-associated protein family)